MSAAYDRITAEFIEALEEGTVPWRRPWSGADGMGPRSLSTGKAYQGINVLVLGSKAARRGWDSVHWGTFKAVRAAGGCVRKGEKATPIVFWSFVDRKNKVTGEKDGQRPILRMFSVFNARQCDGLEVAEPDAVARPEPIPACEAASASYLQRSGVELQHGYGRACYMPSLDVVQMPEASAFDAQRFYYGTLFHELAHSTGHDKRLKRGFDNAFGSEPYAREELTAEMAASFVCEACGILDDTLFANDAAYLASWIRALRSDPRAVVVAAGKASKAADMILDRAVQTTEAKAA